MQPLDLDDISQFFEAYITSERMIGFLCNTHDPDLVSDLEKIQVNLSVAQAERNFLLICKLNADFHMRLAQATKNIYIRDFCAKLHGLARRISLYVFLHELDSNTNADKFTLANKSAHDEIIRKVRNRDNDEMVDSLSRHALLFRDRIVQVISQTHCHEFPVRPSV